MAAAKKKEIKEKSTQPKMRKRNPYPQATKETFSLIESKFIDNFIETGNTIKAYRRARGVPEDGSADGMRKDTISGAANRMRYDPKIYKEINRRLREIYKANIATAEEVMDYFTRVMRGEVKDQFGLETPIGERTKAAQELAKRTVDVEQSEVRKADAKVEIVLDWKRE